MAKKLISSRKGRKCKYRGCKRILNIYNHGIYCHIHRILALREQV